MEKTFMSTFVTPLPVIYIRTQNCSKYFYFFTDANFNFVKNPFFPVNMAQ